MILRAGSLALAILLLPSLAHAQKTPAFQSGAVGPRDAVKFSTQGLIEKAGGLFGDANGRGINPHSITDGSAPGSVSNIPGLGLCFNSNTTGGSNQYYSTCAGHDSDGNSLWTADAYGGAVAKGFKIRINGSSYDFPGTGNGNIIGPSPTIVNELASWNSTGGTALRQGAGRITDSLTAALPATDAASLEIKSQTAASAQQVFSCILHPTCASTPANYDAVRGVAVNPNGSLNLLTNGVASYVMNSATRANPVASNPYPVTVNFFGVSICDADNCGVWGLNTALADSRGTNPSVHGTRYLFNELDFQVTSVNTQVSGLNFTGASTAQPTYAAGTGCLTLDQASGTIARWTACHISINGATDTFASIGAVAATGTNIMSQNFSFGFLDGAGAPGGTTMAAGPTGLLIAATSAAAGSLVLGTADANFQTTNDNTGLLLNSRFAVLGQAGLLSIGSDLAWTTVSVGSGTGALNLNALAEVNVTNGKNLHLSGGGLVWVEARVAPSNPPVGSWYLYVDTGDANKLKAKASTGTTVTLGTP